MKPIAAFWPRSRATKQSGEQCPFLPTKGESNGIGLVALRDNDKYAQFRETLKNLLCLSTITQDQMRDRLLMLVGLPTDKYALDVRELFGEDYDRILRLKHKLLRFKQHQRSNFKHRPHSDKVSDKVSEEEGKINPTPPQFENVQTPVAAPPRCADKAVRAPARHFVPSKPPLGPRQRLECRTPRPFQPHQSSSMPTGQ